MLADGRTMVSFASTFLLLRPQARSAVSSPTLRTMVTPAEEQVS